jgi:2-polyprenyl-3-methyl-5-hydroxy-6-metoxy-1,4-benzoquinol methylase
MSQVDYGLGPANKLRRDMISATKNDERFWDKIADKYSREPIRDEEAYNQKLEMTREYFTRKCRVFEFGCGTGSTALVHAPYVAQIDATDLSSEMIAIAKAKAAEAEIENLSFTQADIADIMSRDGAYDVVLGLSILHLLRDHKAVLGKVRELLKPGGVFVSSTACLAEMGVWRLLLPVMRAIGKAPHVAVFARDDLIIDLTEAGFEIIHQWQPKKNAAVFLVARKL